MVPSFDEMNLVQKISSGSLVTQFDLICTRWKLVIMLARSLKDGGLRLGNCHGILSFPLPSLLLRPPRNPHPSPLSIFYLSERILSSYRHGIIHSAPPPLFSCSYANGLLCSLPSPRCCLGHAYVSVTQQESMGIEDPGPDV